MLRGEFRRADGLVIPNNIMTAGARAILDAACKDSAISFWAGLTRAAPTAGLLLSEIPEPEASNGYSRIAIPRNSTGWSGSGDLNGEPYLETFTLTWNASGSGYNIPVNRLMIVSAETGGNLLALSSPMPQELTFGPSTPIVNRQFVYRIYLR